MRSRNYSSRLASDADPERFITPYLRLKQIVAPHGLLPISASTWWQGVKEGRYPQPVKLSKRVTAWNGEDIADFLERLQAGDA